MFFSAHESVRQRVDTDKNISDQRAHLIVLLGILGNDPAIAVEQENAGIGYAIVCCALSHVSIQQTERGDDLRVFVAQYRERDVVLARKPRQVRGAVVKNGCHRDAAALNGSDVCLQLRELSLPIACPGAYSQPSARAVIGKSNKASKLISFMRMMVP